MIRIELGNAEVRYPNHKFFSLDVIEQHIRRLEVTVDHAMRVGLGKGLQIKEFLSIARDFLQKMVRAASIKDSVMSVIYKISDFTYVVFECDLIL